MEAAAAVCRAGIFPQSDWGRMGLQLRLSCSCVRCILLWKYNLRLATSFVHVLLQTVMLLNLDAACAGPVWCSQPPIPIQEQVQRSSNAEDQERTGSGFCELPDSTAASKRTKRRSSRA